MGAASVGDIGRRLSGILADIAAQRASLQTAVDTATAARDQVHTLSDEPGQLHLSPVVAGFDQAINWLRNADRLLAGAAAAIRAYGQIIGISLPAQPSASAISFRPVAPRPSAEIHQIGQSLPVRRARTEGTSGVSNGERLTSGKDLASVTDLHSPTEGGWPDALSAHVESHTAARMRRQKLTQGELVLNNVTCGNRGFDNDWPMTCEKYLPSILPIGARLTVWATQDGGRTWWTKTYAGTGERIRS